MNLEKKKELAKKVLKAGKHRIKFNPEALKEIKEAITKEDIKMLVSEGMIKLIPIKGRKVNKKRRTRKGPGKIKVKVRTRKKDYVIMVRKQRAYVKDMKLRGKINRDQYIDLRKKIKMKAFKSKAYLKDYIEKLSKGTIDVSEKDSKKTKSRGNKK